MTSREEVYEAIDGERTYQSKWDSCDSKGQHTVAEFILYMEDYLAEARSQTTREADPAGSLKALHTLRKVAALGVACMEQHGAPKR